MLVALLAAVLATPPQNAQSESRSSTAPATSPSVATATAVRVDRPPVIDGKGDDAIWQTAPKISAFRQFQPKVDIDPAFRTEFQVAYDEKNLYVFVRMYDPHPDSIMHALSRRDDRGPSDQIKLLIDSYDDKRSGYELAVNPDGVKRDFSMSNDGQEDASWDGVWDVATRVDSLGWTAEYRVPLSQLRYAPAESHTFGFGVWRDIERFKERDAWPLYDPRKSGLSSQLGELTGLVGLTSERRVEAVPYTVTKNVQRIANSGAYSRAQQATIGGDMKLGITPNVTLDATVNPDFGQVEADPAVLNLSAFETFYSERRPFFVEGTGLYQFQLNCYIVVDCNTNEGLFYSRRIGRSPTLSGYFGDNGTATATPILAAGKLTGRTKDGLNFGILDAATQRVPGANGMTAEPQANYAVLVAKQDLNKGQTGVGLIATAVDRSLDIGAQPYLNKSAYAAGANYRDKFDKGQYEFNAQFTASQVSGSAADIARVQQSSVHYYQQPGGHAVLDTTRTSLNGWEGQLKFGKYGGGITRVETSVIHMSEGYDVNDLGYLRRADLTDWSTWGALSWQNGTKYYRWAQINGNHAIAWNSSGTKLYHTMNFNGHMGLTGPLDNWDVHMGSTMTNLSRSYCDRCTRGGPVTGTSRSFYPWAGFNSDSRKTLSGGFWFNGWYGDEGNTHGYSLSPYVNYRIGTQFSANLSPGYTKDTQDAQWFGNFTDSLTGVTHYSFAHLAQTTVSMTLRATYTATPNLTYELYGQPFVSSGTYSNVRELSATPTSSSYDARFKPYAPPSGNDMEFKYTQLRTNAVVRWEYRPGSTLFVVWQHGRQDYTNTGSQEPWARDYGDLFSLHPDNTFLVKLAYWFNR